MRQYTGKERLIAAFKREYADRVPVTVALGLLQARIAGISIKEFLTKPDKLAQAVIKYYSILQPDNVLIYGDTYLEAEAIGAEIEFREDGPPRLKKPLLEDKSTLVKLNLPDPRSDKRLPYNLEACQRVFSEIQDAGVSALVNGPWNIAVNLRGAQELIYDTADDPAFVHELMRFTTEVVKGFGDAQRDTGVALSLADAAASCSLISPDIYRGFVKPYHEEIAAHFKQKKTGVAIHICGYIDPIMEDVLTAGFAAISIDGPSSLKRLVELSQQKVVVMGNVPTELFSEGTKEQIEEATKSCLEIGARGSAYILSSGCEIPYTASLENIHHFLEVGRQYGRYNKEL